MKKKLLVTDGKGNYGHAVEKERRGVEYIEVRMFDNYDKVHTTNWTSFLIYYEVLDETEGD